MGSAFLAALKGALELQHLLPLAVVLLTLAGVLRAFGLPRVLIPDDLGPWTRVSNGIATSGFLLALALAIGLSDPVRIDGSSAAGVTLGSYLALSLLGAAVPLVAALLRRRREKAAMETTRAPDREVDDPMRPTLAEAATFAAGLAPGLVTVTLLLATVTPPEGRAQMPAVALLAVVLATLFLFLAASWSPASAGASVAAFFAWAVLVWGFFDDLGVPGPVVAAALVALAVYARIRRGDPYRFVPVGLDPKAKAPLTEIDEAGWRDLPRAASGHAFEDEGTGPLRPLVLVCVSGGGGRAAVWATRTLVELERRSEGRFRPHVVFGASGGMLGATRYATAAPAPDGAGPGEDPRIAAVEQDGLRALVQRLLTRDLPGYFAPWIDMDEHRGVVIERTWRRAFGLGDGDLLLGDHRGPPHLVFSPMCVEDGRRVLISDLRLPHLTQARGPETKHRPAEKDLATGPEPEVLTEPRERYSTAAFEYRTLFGEAAAAGLSLFSAIRFSATFPYFMPISSLPTEPRRRLVDAGYYDNYGVSLAAGWLDWALDDPERFAWLEREVSRVVVVQIRDGVLDLTRPLDQVLRGAAEDDEGDAHRGRIDGRRLVQAFESLTGPLRALTQFRESAQLFGNDERLADVLRDLNQRMAERRGDAQFATTVSFELGVRASLTWALSRLEKIKIAAFSKSERFRRRVDTVVALLEERGRPDRTRGPAEQGPDLRP